MKFTVEITDPVELAGITAARKASESGIETDAEYVQWVMQMAARSYAQMYPQAPAE